MATPSSAELERIHEIITTARRPNAPADTPRAARAVDTPTAKRLSFASDSSPLVTTARPTRTRAILVDSDTDEQPVSRRQHTPESSDGAASSSGNYHSASSGDDDLAFESLAIQVWQLCFRMYFLFISPVHHLSYACTAIAGVCCFTAAEPPCLPRRRQRCAGGAPQHRPCHTVRLRCCCRAGNSSAQYMTERASACMYCSSAV